MKKPGFIIAAVVLAGLLGLLYWSNRHPKTDTTTTPMPTPAEPAPQILALNEGDINKIELKRKGVDQIVITRDSGGKWQIMSPQAMGVDESAVSGILSSLSSLNSERLIEEKATNPGRYGLTEPALEVAVTDKNNTPHRLLIGNETPTNNGAYVQLSGDPRVFTIASYTRTSLDKTLNDLRDKRLITADADKITRLELVGKKETIEFSRDKEQWQILKPKPLRADGTKVDELARKVTDAKMELSASTAGASTAEVTSPSPTQKASPSPAQKAESTPAAAFAAGTVVASVKLTTDSGTQQIEVRKAKDDYYAKSSVVDGVFKVASDLGEALDKQLDDFRNKRVFDFGFNDPSKIEIHDGAKTYSLSKSGEDWSSADGKKFEKDGAQALVAKLRDLEATEFADSGFGTAVLDLTVTSNDGKRVEKVSISKGNKNPLARRNGESAFYVLDPKTIEELQKLLSDLKS